MQAKFCPAFMFPLTLRDGAEPLFHMKGPTVGNQMSSLITTEER